MIRECGCSTLVVFAILVYDGSVLSLLDDIIQSSGCLLSAHFRIDVCEDWLVVEVGLSDLQLEQEGTTQAMRTYHQQLCFEKALAGGLAETSRS